MKTFWADLHNHNEIGYGKGSLERSYETARNSLDIYALTVHGFWPDPPKNDPTLAAYHQAGFDRVRADFSRVVNFANSYCRPQAFVAFIAFEWHSKAWGDYVTLFPGGDGELCPSPNLARLKHFCRHREGLLIPHHVAYHHGSRGLNWNEFDSRVSPLVEIYSEHGNSLEREGLYGMYGHSMGGSTNSQCAMEQLRGGRRFGFTAGTDNHDGHPGSYGEGLTAVLASSLSRAAVFEALKLRHTYAVTGDRMGISFRCNGATMGDILPANSTRSFVIEIEPLAPLEFVQVLKNGDSKGIWPGKEPAPERRKGAFLIRLEWGWGRMDAAEATQWNLDLNSTGGSIIEVFPCFVGGPASSELTNSYTRLSDSGLRIRSFTGRQNPHPTSGLVVVLKGDENTELRCFGECETNGEKGACDLRVRIVDLLSDDAWGRPLKRFSSPRIRIGRAFRKEGLRFRAHWTDEEAAGEDFYILKAQQKNGQIAWSSPIFFGP